jgi:tRNA threonylcarbamoyladenosine biosynthesis protein TsaB
MAIILAIETSTELASAALLRDGKTIMRESQGVQTHSQTILPMVQSLLAEAGMRLTQCDAIAFGAGPGSFTGVRTACGIAQGLAFGADLPVVPVVTLQAMAQACHNATGASDVLALLDARMEEVYWAQYRFSERWHTIIEPTLSPASAVSPIGNVTACGNGLTAYASAFKRESFAEIAQHIATPHAVDVAQLAHFAFMHGETVVPRNAQPLYLRNKVAFTMAERLVKAAT